MPHSKNKNSLDRSPALALLVACSLCALGFLVVSRLSSSRDSTKAPSVADAGPSVKVDSAPGARIAERTRTLDDALPASSAIRPEKALLEDLPGARMTRSPDCPLNDLRVSFKLEPRLTRSLYMGDRWTSPATYLQVGAGQDCTVEASIRGLNAQGKAVNTAASWRVADPDMVKISEPRPGNTVQLTVVRPGETTLEIASEGITKELPLHAVSYGGTLLVAMAQE